MAAPAGDTGLDLLELRRIHDGMITWWQNGSNFLLGCADPLRQRRMRGKGANARRQVWFLQLLTPFEKSNEGVWFIARLVEVLDSEIVRLGFKAPPKLKGSDSLTEPKRIVELARRAGLAKADVSH